MADRKISDLTALTTPALGDFLPIVDISEAAAASKNKRITIEELFRGVPLGTAAAPSIAIEGDEDTGVFSPGANQLAISTNGTQRLSIDAGGNTHVIAVDGQLSLSKTGLRQYQFRVTGAGATEGLAIRDETVSTEIARFTQGGYLTVGGLRFKGTDTQNSIYQSAAFGISSDNYITVGTGGAQAERLRIDSLGRLLVGTSTARSNFYNSASFASSVQLEGTSSATSTLSLVSNQSSANQYDQSTIVLGRSGGSSLGSNTIVANNNAAGAISFQGNDGSEFVPLADISAFVDGTPGANDMPGRLVLSTTADGAASPTERLRITSAGVLQVADAGNIAVGTTTGTKIGTATTQKLGFYNATPVVQPAAVADATTAVDVITQLNALLAKLRTLGIIAT
jgi:hypothetical protein